MMKRKPSISVFLLTLLLAAVAVAQDVSIVKPDTVGLSPDRLDRIAATVQRNIDDKRISGAVTLVARRGHVAWFKAQGMMDREAGKPMRPDAMFRICSMTKPITSVAVMMLYEEGRFLLDDPISKYLPEFKNPRVLVKPAMGESYTIPATREITIRDLLRHTSGLTYHWNADLGPLYNRANVGHGVLPYDGTIEDNVKRLASVPLLFNPGERWEYGLSVDVLGRLVEVVSGKPLDEFFRVRIFEPLGHEGHIFLSRPATSWNALPRPIPTMRTRVSIAFPILRSQKERTSIRPTILTVVPRSSLQVAPDLAPRRRTTCASAR